MSTTDNNKLIAEFLGYEPNTNGVYPIFCINEGEGWHLETMKYHSDWNWLMEVIEKILNVSLELDSMEMYYNITDSIPKIDKAYNDCVEFIKWYNDENNR